MHQCNARQRGLQSMADRVELRIADLRAKLHINQDQQSLWDKFAQVMRDNAKHMAQLAEERATKLSMMNASDNLQSYAQIAVQRGQDLQSLAGAFQPLYPSLSDDQKRTADAMFRAVGIRYTGRPRR